MSRSRGFLAALLAAGVLPAQEPAPRPAYDELAGFAQAAIESLAEARDAQEAVSKPGRSASADPSAETLRVRTARREAILLLTRAQSRLRPYIDSRSGELAGAVSGFVTAYSVLAQVLEADLRLEERLADVTEDESLGALLSDASRHRAMADEAWLSLPVAAFGLCRALVDGTRTSPEGPAASLLMTERQRSDLLKSVETRFGPEVGEGKAAGPRSAAAAAAAAGALARCLREARQTSDGK